MRARLLVAGTIGAALCISSGCESAAGWRARREPFALLGVLVLQRAGRSIRERIFGRRRNSGHRHPLRLIFTLRKFRFCAPAHHRSDCRGNAGRGRGIKINSATSRSVEKTAGFRQHAAAPDGKSIWVPQVVDQCWDRQLPCTPYFHAGELPKVRWR